jgi:hypothetical protein
MAGVPNQYYLQGGGTSVAYSPEGFGFAWLGESLLVTRAEPGAAPYRRER